MPVAGGANGGRGAARVRRAGVCYDDRVAEAANRGRVMTMILYDLSDVASRPVSPYAMRSRGALAALGLSYDERLLHLGEIRGHFDGKHRTVPVLRDGDVSIGDSRAIAEYLAEHHDPDGRLFGDGDRRRLTGFIVDWVDATLMGQINHMTVLDSYHLFRPEDQAYFRRFEEERIGMTLEEAHAERDRHVPAFQISLHPARRALKQRPFLGGAEPSYADVVLHAAFEWARTVSDFKLLRDDDRLHGWIATMDARLGQAGGRTAGPPRRSVRRTAPRPIRT